MYIFCKRRHHYIYEYVIWLNHLSHVTAMAKDNGKYIYIPWWASRMIQYIITHHCSPPLSVQRLQQFVLYPTWYKFRGGVITHLTRGFSWRNTLHCGHLTATHHQNKLQMVIALSFALPMTREPLHTTSCQPRWLSGLRRSRVADDCSSIIVSWETGIESWSRQ